MNSDLDGGMLRAMVQNKLRALSDLFYPVSNICNMVKASPVSDNRSCSVFGSNDNVRPSS